ncbi:MAG: hypothetical protein COB09_18810 [Thalassobium sp.]|nr:MAG: hypothetical protein COB09_18810 [Thalassobium sp.]
MSAEIRLRLIQMLLGQELRTNETAKIILNAEELDIVLVSMQETHKYPSTVHKLSQRVASAEAAQHKAEDAFEKQKFDLLDANPQWGETNERLASRIGELADNLSNAYKRVNEADERTRIVQDSLLKYQHIHLELNNKLKHDKAHVSAMGRQNQAITSKLQLMQKTLDTQAFKFSNAMGGKDKIIDALLQEKLKLQVSFGSGEEVVLDTQTFSDQNIKLNLTYNEPEPKEDEDGI